MLRPSKPCLTCPRLEISTVFLSFASVISPATGARSASTSASIISEALSPLPHLAHSDNQRSSCWLTKIRNFQRYLTTSHCKFYATLDNSGAKTRILTNVLLFRGCYVQYTVYRLKSDAHGYGTCRQGHQRHGENRGCPALQDLLLLNDYRTWLWPCHGNCVKRLCAWC